MRSVEACRDASVAPDNPSDFATDGCAGFCLCCCCCGRGVAAASLVLTAAKLAPALARMSAPVARNAERLALRASRRRRKTRGGVLPWVVAPPPWLE